jgi:predicted outer membrane repeat protein
MLTRYNSRKGRPAPVLRSSFRLRADALEGRLTPASFYVPPGDTAAFIAAINSCNVNNQPDTIDLATGSTYTFTAAADSADGGSALPTILRDSLDANTVTIHGNGATLQRSTDAGTPQFRFLRIGVFPNNVSASISDLTFVNGDAGTNKGGAILQQSGDLTVTGCTFKNDHGDSGGAIYDTTIDTSPRLVSISNSTFTGNAATNTTSGSGGAVSVSGSSGLTVAGSQFDGNTSIGSGGAVQVSTSSGSVSITGSQFTNNTAGQSGSGGAVFIQAVSVTIANMTVQHNTSGGSGGGVWIQGAPTTITNSVVSNNTSGGSGGGLFSQGATTITNSALQNNTSGASGGGVFAQSGSLTISGDTIAGNTLTSSTSGGGGVYCQATNLSVVDCTIDSNRAGNGGGLAFVNGAITGTITNSTITDNRAFFGLAKGGGIEVTGTGTLSLGNTIVAGNAFDPGVSNGTGPDIGGPVTSLGYNLIQNTQGATITGSQTGNITGVSANLAPLADNGGPTPTRIPNAGSPVIDNGDPNFAPPPAADQRGLPRVVNGRIDIGAVEVPLTGVSTVVIGGGTAQRSEVRSLTINFADKVTFAGGDANAAAAFQLTHVQTGANVVLSAAVSTDAKGRTVVTLGFSGSETDPVSALNGGAPSLADGRYTLTIFANSVTGPGGLALDGNGDGAAGGDYVSPADTFGGTGLHLYRLFGDASGDGVVDATDLGQFRSTFNANNSQANYLAYLDADNSGSVDAQDLGQFRSRFNANVF